MISYTADNVIRLKVLSDNEPEIDKVLNDFYENSDHLVGCVADSGVDFESKCIMLSMKKNEDGYYYSPFTAYKVLQNRYTEVVFYGVDCYMMWDDYRAMQILVTPKFANIVGGPVTIDINSIDEIWDLDPDMHLFGKREEENAEEES